MSQLVKPERILKKIGIFALCTLVVVYVARQLISLVNSNIETETVLAVTGEESIDLACYIMRDETVLTSPSDGIMLATTDDGGRISKDKEAVRIYYEERDYSVEMDIREIDNKIDILRKSTVDTAYVSADIKKMDDDISELLANMQIYSSKNDLVGALSRKDDILVRMNKRWLITNPGKNFENRIVQLSTERATMQNGLSGNSVGIVAPASGYYFAHADGYENIFSSTKVQGLSVEEFEKMVNSAPEEYTGKVAGKIVTDFKWYIACPANLTQASYFDTGETYSVDFTYNYGVVMEMTLHSKLTDNKNGKAVMIFVSNEMPEDFDFTRNQKVRIVYKKYKGLKVPKSAIRVVNDIKGVYVVRGTQIEFKRAEEIYSFDDYYIIDSDHDSPNYQKKYVRSISMSDDGKTEKVEYYGCLSLYDNVVVKGKDIYDGMKVD